MSNKAQQITQSMITKVSKDSGVSAQDVEAVLKSLGLEDLCDRISTTIGENFDMHKISGVEIAARYDKMMIVK